MKEEFIIYYQTHTNTHTSQTPRPQANLLHACNCSRGPHRHVLDKDRQIRQQHLRQTTALALITGWRTMKETDDMYLFVFSSSALNQVNTAIADDGLSRWYEEKYTQTTDRENDCRMRVPPTTHRCLPTTAVGEPPR